jgi:hypothetical protein
MDQKLLDVLNMVHKQDFSQVVGNDRITIEPLVFCKTFFPKSSCKNMKHT